MAAILGSRFQFQSKSRVAPLSSCACTAGYPAVCWESRSDQLGELLDEMPNMNVGIGAIIAELGRQPRFAKKFFEKYQDRILFGKDSWKPEEFPTYFRVLETDDEYFPYHKKYHAFWAMYGLDLSDEVLKKVYYKNALNLVPGLDKTLFPE